MLTRFLTLASVFLVVLSLLSCSLPAAQLNTPSATNIKIVTVNQPYCQLTPTTTNTRDQNIIELLVPSLNNINTWNHNSPSQGFTALKQETSKYSLTQNNASSDGCQATGLSTILVKKLGDWDQQHINGIEFLAAHQPKELATITSVAITLKIDALLSYSPSQALLLSSYENVIPEKAILTLANQNYFLGVTLYSPFSEDRNEPTFNASTIIELSLSSADKWLTVNIPINAFFLFTQENYQEEAITLAQFNKRLLKGLRIVAETKDTNVARNSNPAYYSEHSSLSEHYKEIALHIASIELH